MKKLYILLIFMFSITILFAKTMISLIVGTKIQVVVFLIVLVKEEGRIIVLVFFIVLLSIKLIFTEIKRSWVWFV